MKKLMCALLVCVLCACALTGCGRKAPVSDDAPAAESKPTAEPGETPVPDEGSHGEEDQSKVLEEMPTVPPAVSLEGGDTPADAGDRSSDDYFSVDDLLNQPSQEFETYDEAEAQEAHDQTGVSVIDPNTYSFSAMPDTTLGFTFNYPTGWQSIPGIYTICYREPVESGDYPARVSVSAKKLVHTPEGSAVMDELTAFVRAIYKQYDAKTFQLGTARSDDTFMGKKAYSNTYLAYSGETEVKGFIIGRAVGKVMYVFHFNASYEDYTAMESLMRYMVKSVQLVEE